MTAALTLLAALASLDVQNDAHWTADGSPRLETVRALAADASVSREAVTSAAPQFCRENPVLPGAQQPQQATAAPQQAPVAPWLAVPLGTALAVAPAGAQASQVEAGDEPLAAGGLLAPGASQEPAGAPEQDEFRTAVARLEAASRAAAQATQAQAEASKEVDRLLQERERAGIGRETVTEQIGAYLASQKRLLAQRGEQRRILAEAGLKVEDLLPLRSKLDAALQRKTGRGGQRPAIPLKR